MKQNKNQGRDSKQQEEGPRRVQVSFFTTLHHQNQESTMNYEWPEFRTEKERIKAFSKRYKDTTFEDIFGVQTKITIPDVPSAPQLGSTYKVDISRVGNDVDIFGMSLKETVICRNNLKRYKNMAEHITGADAKIVSIDKARQTVTIDVLQPVFDNWINAIMADKSIQYNTKTPKMVTVHNLHLMNGGFVGKAEIPSVSEFVGEPYYVDAFIPGSQIVLNIEKDFSQWEGKTVDTFVAGYTSMPNSVNKMSLICSRKALLNFSGNLSKIELYNEYCSNSKKWQTFTKSVLVGTITGVINSAKKCGVFVEIPMLNITGMINTAPDELVNFKSGRDINVRITGFEQMLTYDPTTGNMVHAEPYKIEDGCLKSCILKPVLELA